MSRNDVRAVLHAGLSLEQRLREVADLRGDASKAKEVLGWEPRTTFEDLVRIMVDADVKLLEDELSGRLVRPDRD